MNLHVIIILTSVCPLYPIVDKIGSKLQIAVKCLTDNIWGHQDEKDVNDQTNEEWSIHRQGCCWPAVYRVYGVGLLKVRFKYSQHGKAMKNVLLTC